MNCFCGRIRFAMRLDCIILKDARFVEVIAMQVGMWETMLCYSLWDTFSYCKYAYRFACAFIFLPLEVDYPHTIGISCYSLCDTSPYLWQICIESQVHLIFFFFARSGLFACSRNVHCWSSTLIRKKRIFPRWIFIVFVLRSPHAQMHNQIITIFISESILIWLDDCVKARDDVCFSLLEHLQQWPKWVPQIKI